MTDSDDVNDPVEEEEDEDSDVDANVLPQTTVSDIHADQSLVSTSIRPGSKITKFDYKGVARRRGGSEFKSFHLEISAPSGDLTYKLLITRNSCIFTISEWDFNKGTKKYRNEWYYFADVRVSHKGVPLKPVTNRRNYGHNFNVLRDVSIRDHSNDIYTIHEYNKSEHQLEAFTVLNYKFLLDDFVNTGVEDEGAVVDHCLIHVYTKFKGYLKEIR